MLMSRRKLRLCTWPSPVATRTTAPCLGEGWGLTKLSMSFACFFRHTSGTAFVQSGFNMISLFFPFSVNSWESPRFLTSTAGEGFFSLWMNRRGLNIGAEWRHQWWWGKKILNMFNTGLYCVIKVCWIITILQDIRGVYQQVGFHRNYSKGYGQQNRCSRTTMVLVILNHQTCNLTYYVPWSKLG